MRIAVIGLGYVGLPLVIEFGKRFSTTGFDIKSSLIKSYKKGIDPAGEVENSAFTASGGVNYTDDIEDIRDHDIYIVAVPTPVDDAKQPDLTPLTSASELLGSVMGKGCVVVYESTVYPGATEEVCVPILEQSSGLTWTEDFNVGYSPERISPSDKERTITRIVKVVSADCEETLDKVSKIYESIVEAGIHRAPSIKVAEAAKVIENAQRDLNIAFVNELAIIFDKMGIDTKQVLQAAGTKWNFLKFEPGLVGGHCIGVDPYYLTSKAQSLGYLPEVILAGRRINDGMGRFIARKTVKKMFSKGFKGSPKVLVCGLTFKQNCADLRNSQVVQVIQELKEYNVEVYVHDPIADKRQALDYYGINLVDWQNLPQVDAIILAVPHQQLLDQDVSKFHEKLDSGGVFIDIKSALDPADFIATNIDYWRLSR